jgi:hypothetical protein
MYEQLLALKYPNGRTRICTVTSKREPNARAEFEMFGRAWRVSHVHHPRRSTDPTSLVCITVGNLRVPLRRSRRSACRSGRGLAGFAQATLSAESRD